MCTLIAAVRQYARFPLVVAANRDEVLARPASPPVVWDAPARFIAPRDEKAGGTWLGLTAGGLFVAVTNRFGVPRDDSRRSRGMVVLEALSAPSAKELHGRLAVLQPAAYNAFHLLYADREGAFVTWSDGTTLRQDVLGPGIHVVTERSLGGDDRARTELVRSRYPPVVPDAPPSVDALAGLLRLHAPPEDPVAGTCIHIPALGYGTRSSLVLRLGPTLAQSELAWAEGSPCTHPMVPRPDLFKALGTR
jgi:uncharacterized protein with NRDE domain